MLRSIKSLHGYKILATDGDIGKLHEFLFDDESWAIAYLVLDTGTWLPGRKVLLAPVSLGQPDWLSHNFPVALTKEKIENSPSIDVDKPVSRQQRERLHQYYDWPVVWAAAGGAHPIPPTPPPIPAAEDEPAPDQEEKGDPHLRSTREVIGYHIQAADGEIGHVEDFIVEDEKWVIRYMVIDTKNWLPGRKVLIAPSWISFIRWNDNKVGVDLTKDAIEKSPEYDPSAPVNREYEARLYDYYGRPRYWP